MGDEDTLLDLTGRIYDSALQPDRWPETLHRIGDAVGRSGAHLEIGDLRSHAVAQSVTTRADPYYIALFQQKFQMRTDRHAVYENFAHLPVGTPVPREMIESDADWLRSAFYNEVFRPLDLYHAATTVLVKQEDCIAQFGIYREAAAGPFGHGELTLVRRLVPHLQRAVEVHRRLAAVMAERNALADSLDRLPLGVILVDAAGAVMFLNRSAADVVAAGDGLTVSGGRLTAATTAQNAALAKVVAEAALTGAGQGLSPGGALALARPSMRRPLAVLVAPLRGGEAVRLDRRTPAAVVFVSDPERRDETPERVLARLYGLTRTEAALAAALMQGQRLAHAADRLGISLNTAKTHLQRVFDKTDTHHQTELVRLLLKGPAGLRFS